jgi:hypothetical protein
MKKTYADKVSAAKGALTEYNSKVGEASRIDAEGFEKGLAEKLGAFDESTLELVTVQDLTDTFKVPNALARRLVQIFKDQVETPSGTTARRITATNAPTASVEELVAAYDPQLPTTPAAEELKKRTHGSPCVAFRADGKVDYETTVREASAVANGEAAREHATVDGKPVKLYPIGERPPQTADEHPLRRGDSLRKDGTDSLGLNWTSVPLNVRQLLRLAIETGELRINSNDGIHDTHERAKEAEAFSTLSSRYPQAAIRFAELEGTGALPTLKINRGGTRPNDPFHQAATAHRAY